MRLLPIGVTGREGMSRLFAPGERAMLLDSKGRRYLVTLAAGGSFHSHAGFFSHDLLIGQPEGTTARTGSGARYLAVRPTLPDFVLKMPRGAQVIYPKDLGQILVLADVFPGARVLEAGVGSGALSMTMLRAGASVSGYEIRPEFAARARENVGSFLGAEALERYQVREADVYEGIAETGLDRVVLDLPEPWRVAAHAAAALRPGGIFLAYLPTINQTAQLREVLAEEDFVLAESLEVLLRTWHIEGRSVRPDHRMVAHTGFLTHARYIGS
jgi:tRNA (adenine57-N1/adenine58-N1)-methyltransferase